MSALWASAAAFNRADDRSAGSPCCWRVALTRHRSAVRTFGSGSALAAERVKEHPVPCAAASEGTAQSAMTARTAAMGTLPSPDRMTSIWLPVPLPCSCRLRGPDERGRWAAGARGRRTRRPLVVGSVAADVEDEGRAGKLAVDGDARHDADADVVEVAVEDDGAMARRVHPRGDDRLRARELALAPGDVLAEGVVVVADVAGAARAVGDGAGEGRDVSEEAVRDHVRAVALGGFAQLAAGMQRGEPVGGAPGVDEAADGPADGGRRRL